MPYTFDSAFTQTFPEEEEELDLACITESWVTGKVDVSLLALCIHLPVPVSVYDTKTGIAGGGGGGSQ